MKRFEKSFWRAVVGAVALSGGVGRAAETPGPLNPPAPLAQGASATPAADRVLARAAAQHAQELGFSSEAVSAYRQLLAEPGADRAELTLALATTLLEAGEAAEAERVLLALTAPREAAWHLRVGLAAMQLKKRDVAQVEWDATKWEELAPSDLPWYWFLAGALWDTLPGGDSKATEKANEYYLKAENAPGLNDLARARFQLGAEEVRLRRGAALNADGLRTARQNYETNRGTKVGYDSAQQYVLALVTLDRKQEAMTFLQTVVLPVLPMQERDRWNDFRLLLGLIGDRGRSVAGRRALSEILMLGNEPRRQRQALQLLWEAADGEIARGQLRTELDRMIGQKPNHPILESLLFYRAQLAAVERRDDEAREKASRLLEEFPGSALRAQAYGLLTQLAWKQGRFRLAADNARKARTETANATDAAVKAARAELGVVEAEAWFRAGDFRDAADTYAAVLRERPANVAAGALIFQRVISEIRSGAADAAAAVIDGMKSDPAFDVENQWEAEWSLAREWLAQRKIPGALARVTRLLAETRAAGASVPPELVARMKWLQARLSLEANQPEQTVALVDALLSSLGGIAPALAVEIKSTALLIKAEAEFALWESTEAAQPKAERQAAALATLQKVRTEHPDSEAAARAYIDEAAHYEKLGQIVEAQKRLRSMTENHKASALVPYAFFQLALLSSERLGKEKDLNDANGYIEELVTSVAAKTQDDLVFRARLKQGEIHMRRNDYPAAQQAFALVKDRPGPVEYQIMARLELAMSHSAQSFADPAHAEIARSLFDELHDRVDASVDVRVEAGYNLGWLHERRGKADEAAKVWWQDVVVRFLLNPEPSVKLGATASYWISRTLLDLGRLYVEQEKTDEAKRAYQLILERNLSGQGLAKAALEKLGVPTTRQ